MVFRWNRNCLQPLTPNAHLVHLQLLEIVEQRLHYPDWCPFSSRYIPLISYKNFCFIQFSLVLCQQFTPGHVNLMGAVWSSIFFTVPRFTFTQFFFRGLFENWRLPPFLQTRPHTHSLHPHPAGPPDALSLVPRACRFPPSGGQNVDAALWLSLSFLVLLFYR